MPRDFIYCATDRQVPANETQRLLLGQFNAIWCPPLRLPTLPSQHDRVWLVWRPHRAAKTSPFILGGGRIAADPNGHVLWTDKTLHGVTQAAQSLGYGGPRQPKDLFETDRRSAPSASVAGYADSHAGIERRRGPTSSSTGYHGAHDTIEHPVKGGKPVADAVQLFRICSRTFGSRSLARAYAR